MDNSVTQDLHEYLDIDLADSLAKHAEQEASETRREALRMFLLSMLPDLMQMDDREVRQFKKTMLTTVDDILSAKSK
ncbi:hypothetical protein LSTR_LSTR016263 [Laodelphax striatellus]|uniref:Uncharacterized protein n=1 Tax=Laodelphax striatellus TaxID=195883 RepID=A0A482XD23_LAOST|nr:hypothetical protein LSTR_LSTR016263 [Laodelphax striatellus]